MIEDYKFLESDFAGKSIADLPTRPGESGMSAQQVKEAFDQVPKVIMALGKLNNFFDYLGTPEAAADIGAVLPDGTSGKLQSALAALKSLVVNLGGDGITTETVIGAHERVSQLSADLLAETGSGKVGMGKMYPDDSSGSTVNDKLIKLAQMVVEIDKFTPRGILNAVGELPQTGNAYGDFFYIRTSNPQIFTEYVWISSSPDKWELYGEASLYILSDKADRDLGNVSSTIIKNKVEGANIGARHVAFSNAETGLSSTNVQDALAEVDNQLSVVGVPATSAGTGAALTTSLPGRNLIDRLAIRLRLHEDVQAGATLDFNGTGHKPILYGNGSPISAWAKAGSSINIEYNATDVAWYLLDNAVTDTPQVLPVQVVNYKMLYYCGDECAVDTGGWEIGYTNGGAFTKKPYCLHITGAQKTANVVSKNRIDLTDYVIAALVYDSTSSGSSTYDRRRFAVIDNKIVSAEDTAIVYESLSSGHAKFAAVDITNINNGYLAICTAVSGQTSDVSARAVTLFKSDNFQSVLRTAGITKTYSNPAALVADTAAMATILGNERATRILTLTCTGDLMAAILQSTAWITAIGANETARRIIMANPHWAKFIAVFPSCEPLLNYTMLYDQGDEQNAKTGGWVVSAFGTDSSHNGCMANTLKSLNITSYDEAFVKVGINAVADGGGFGSDERTRIYFSNTQQGFAGHNLIHTEPRIESVIPSELNKIEIFCKSTGLSGLSDGKLYLSTGAYANSSSGRSAQKNENDLQWYFPYHTPNKKIYYHFYEIVLLKPDPYQLWLTAAGITTQYADLAAVLADSSALSILMSNEAAIEYMISCSGTLMAAVCQSQTAMMALCGNPVAYGAAIDNVWWYKFMTMSEVGLAAMDASLQGRKVPTMTSNTVPAGVASASSEHSSGSYSPYKAFDGITSTFWTNLDGASKKGAWLQYDFSFKIIPYKVQLQAIAGRGTITYKIQGSNDGVNFVDLTGMLTLASDGASYNILMPYSSGQYSKLRMYIVDTTDVNGSLVAILQIYGKAVD